MTVDDPGQRLGDSVSPGVDPPAGPVRCPSRTGAQAEQHPPERLAVVPSCVVDAGDRWLAAKRGA